MIKGKNLLQNRLLRANPQYSFQGFSDIDDSTKRLIGTNVEQSGYFGILTGNAGREQSIKAVSKEIFSLFDQLKMPTLADSVGDAVDPKKRDDILHALILEGILEVEIDGGFISGVLAASALMPCGVAVADPGDVLGRMSQQALRHAQRLDIDAPATLAARLYFYNRCPCSPRHGTRWRDVEAVLHYVTNGAGRHVSRLPGDFQLISSDYNRGWIVWHRRQFEPRQTAMAAAKYKLYLSPVIEDLPSVFEAVAELLGSSDALSLKIGADAIGLLRPDKAVIYFEAFESLSTFAWQLAANLCGVRAQGVPFTAAIDEQGLLSWGIDPDWAQSDIGMYADNSWRLWVCNRLALAIMQAKKVDNVSFEPWEYALLKVRYFGINTVSWTPGDYQIADL